MSDAPSPTGISAIPASHALDTAALQRYLKSTLEGFDGPVELRAFSGGQSNPTFQLITPARTYVLRAKPGPAARLLPSAHAIEREYAVMKALHGTGVPVPRVLCLCEDESVIGRAFYIMEFLQGRVLWDPTLPGMQPEERRAIYDSMNQVIAALHTVDFAAVGLGSFGKPGNYFERQIARWTRQYRASELKPIADMDRLIEWLPGHIPASARDASRVSIVHGDFRIDNLIFHPVEPRAIGVLDWELSTLGHPLADFSYHCMAWHIRPGVFRGMAGADLAGLGIPDEQAYIASYCRRTGMGDPAALAPDWNFYLAYNLFRIAAILQGIAKRHEEGTASSPQAAQAAAAAAPLATLGWRYASR